MHRIATVINYCSNEQKFLLPCIEQARLFSSCICIPVADHFFNGEKENISSLKKAYATFPDCTFLQFPFLPDTIPTKWLQQISHPRIWHNIARLIAFSTLPKEIDYILFIDADEIVEGARFLSWLDTREYQEFAVMKLANYWYFRDICFRAKTWEDSVLLVKKSKVSSACLLLGDERDGLYAHIQGPKRRHILGVDKQPMAHHYSWVRSKKQMLKKVDSWGHAADRDWKRSIEEEFSQEFQGKDFVHGYAFEKVEPWMDLSRDLSQKEGDPAIVLSEKKFHKILGIRNFSLSQLLQKIGISS